MKKILFFCIVCIIPICIFGTEQDSLYQFLQSKIIDLEQQIDVIEKQIIEIKPVRDYTTHLLMYITAGFAIIAIVLGLIVPAGIMTKFRKLKIGVNKKLKDNRIQIIAVRTTVQRAMYKMSHKNDEFMLVVWGGRWLNGLSILNNNKSFEKRVIDMGTIIKEIWNKIQIFDPQKLRELAEFENLAGTKKIYHELERFDDKKIKEKDKLIQPIKQTSRKILTKIYEAEKDLRDGSPDVTIEGPVDIDPDDIETSPYGATGPGG